MEVQIFWVIFGSIFFLIDFFLILIKTFLILFLSTICFLLSFILKKINTKSKKNNIDPKITKRIWKNMIWAYIEYERRNFKKK